jgi:hypothetical protein
MERGTFIIPGPDGVFWSGSVMGSAAGDFIPTWELTGARGDITGDTGMVTIMVAGQRNAAGRNVYYTRSPGARQSADRGRAQASNNINNRSSCQAINNDSWTGPVRTGTRGHKTITAHNSISNKTGADPLDQAGQTGQAVQAGGEVVVKDKRTGPLQPITPPPLFYQFQNNCQL